MNAAPPDQTELVTRLRQQLIQAQVRIMELEDVRDQLAPQVGELSGLRRAAQTVADQKLEEAAHLQRVLAEARSRGAALQEQVQLAAGQIARLEQLNQTSAAELGREQDRHAQTAAALRLAQEESAALRLGMEQLEGRLHRLQATRSWRWTAWLRRLFPGPRA